MNRLAFSAWLAGLAFALGSVLGCGAAPPTEVTPPKPADPIAKGNENANTNGAEKKGPAVSGAPVPPEDITEIRELNVGLRTLPPGWERDDNTRRKIGGAYILSYRRAKPEAYVTFGAYEPAKGRAPFPSEMRSHLVQPFPKLFDKSTLREEPSVETKWLGETIAPNHGFKFRAQSPDGLVWIGEAYTVAHKGIAYYWVSWCGEKDYDGLKGEFTAIRSRFQLLGLRDDWKETRSSVVDFKGEKVPYTISDAEELWKEVEVAPYKELDPKLDKLLRASLRSKPNRKAPPDAAELRVYVTDEGGDPLQVARKFAKDQEMARIKEAGDFTLTFKELTLPGDPLQGDPVPADVPATVPVVRLLTDVKEARAASRLIVVSGVTVGKKTVAVVCWCEARTRDRFETRLVQIASSLR